MSEETTTICFCDERLVAESEGTFVRSSLGWWFPKAPLRRMSQRARYHALVERGEFPHTDMTGHPIRWHDCPFCGHTLPGVDTLHPPQADGDSYR